MNAGQLSGGGIKSIQRGVATMAAVSTLNVTVTAVDMAKAELRINGSYPGTNDPQQLALGLLTTSTNIAFQRGSSANSTYVGWELVERY